MFFFRKNKNMSPIDKFMKRAKRFGSFELAEYNRFTELLKAEKEDVTPVDFGLKLVVIADTHGSLSYNPGRFPAFMKSVEEYDLCLLLGDIDYRDMEEIMKLVPREKILAVRGNHDSFDLYELFGIREMSGDVVTCKGARIAAIEGSFRYKNEEFPSFTQYESIEFAKNMEPADILISHDRAFETNDVSPAHAGLAGITYYIYKNKVNVHIHGHLHKIKNEVYDNGTREKCVNGCQYLEI